MANKLMVLSGGTVAGYVTAGTVLVYMEGWHRALKGE